MPMLPFVAASAAVDVPMAGAIAPATSSSASALYLMGSFYRGVTGTLGLGDRVRDGAPVRTRRLLGAEGERDGRVPARGVVADSADQLGGRGARADRGGD